MKTDRLIAMLADGPRAPSRAAVGRRLGSGVTFGVAAALLLLMFAIPGGIPAQALAARLAMPVFWAKLALPVSMTIATASVAARLSQPGVPIKHAWRVLCAPIALVWLAALVGLASAPAPLREALILGHTWRACLTHIVLLSIPGLAALLIAMRGLAPTRPALAGAAVGLLAGAIAALAYCLRCPEMEPPFWATWYLLGMSVPAFVGALLGPRAMRW
ncbi:MAG TPA: DUF1109 domain-containing protein [Paraburkholderia sp.]|jgi:hypothetical protein